MKGHVGPNRERARRRCLGLGEDHYFMSEGPWNRKCAKCSQKEANLRLSPTALSPSRTGFSRDPMSVSSTA